MLARVTSGQSGIVEYLKNGMKSGREFSRDVLDDRVTIDGNINITDVLIKEMNQDGRKENYLHITLSFGERDLKEEKIIEAYRDYKRSIMSAYSDDEFNVYAEIHYPKIKSYRDKKTGDLIERFPHVHMVIPQKNLVSDKALNPFGLYSSNIKFHDAIQETVNRKHELESPYDNQRKYRMNDNSEFISRYKGDSFKGSNSEFKNELFELISTKNIRSMDGFKKELGNYGEVSTGKAGATDEYLQVKLLGKTKNIRLKENAFKAQYIEQRELLREKPSDKEISKNLNNWIDTRSHEMKHIHSASPKVRKEYYALNQEQQKEYIHERRDDFTRRYNTSARSGTDDIRQRGREANREFGITRNGGRRFTEVTNGLPNLSKRNVDGSNREQQTSTKSVLSSNEHDNLEFSPSRPNGLGGDNQLRRADDRSRRGEGRLIVDKSSSLSEQLLSEYQVKTSPEALQQFREIRKKLDPVRVLNHFEKSHGLIKENYQTFKAKDGSARIKVGNRAFNVSDFSTQHMRQDWQNTKDILTTLYKKQLKSEYKKIDVSVIGLNRLNQIKKGLPQKNLWSTKNAEKRVVKKEKQELNSIVFVSGLVTQGKVNQTVTAKLNHSVRVLKHLQQQEKYGINTMEFKIKKDNVNDENTISSSTIDLKTTTDYFKKQQEIMKKLSMKMGDLVPAKDLENGKVEFNDKNTGKPVFQDVGTHIVMSDKKPSIEHVAVAMTFAAEKFGKVVINGSQEFKKQVVDVAVAKDLNVVFADKKMQEMFMKDKANLSATNAKYQGNNPEENSIKDAKVNQSTKHYNQPTQDKNEPVVPLTLVSHGSAPYKNVKDNSQSYFVKTSDGNTEWGVGLKEAMENSKVKIGDEIALKKLGSEEVGIKVDKKDAEGKVIGQETKDVIRVTWEVKFQAVAKDAPQVNDALITKAVDKATDVLEDKKEVKTLSVAYKWLGKEQKMQVTVNGKSPKDIPVETMTAIKTNDKFLSNYSVKDIQSGKLDLSLANTQPVPKTYNTQGTPYLTSQKVQAPKQTQ
jgi:hypothetical protein